jgi:hypothetical protein
MVGGAPNSVPVDDHRSVSAAMTASVEAQPDVRPRVIGEPEVLATRSPAQRLVGIILVLVVALWSVALIWRTKSYTLDDAFITWRYALNLVHHGTWNFNPSGPHVEAYSSTLYAVIAVVPTLIGINVLAFFKLLALGVCLILPVGAIWKRYRPAEIFLILVLTVANPVFVLNMWSGLETNVTVILVAVGLYLAVSDTHRSHLLAFSVLLVLISATRTEGAAYAGVIALVGIPLLPDTPLLSRQRAEETIRYLLRALGPAVVFMIAYLAFRVAWFGELGTGPSWVKFASGDHYANFTANLGQFVPCALISLLFVQGLARGVARVRLTLAWAGMMVIFAVVFLPSDLLMNFFGRFQFMVTWPLVLAAAGCWIRTPRSRWDASPVVLVAAAVLWALPQILPTAPATATILNYYLLVRSHGTLGDVLHNSFPRDTVVMMGDVGLAPYLADLNVVDSVGLALPKPWREEGPTGVMKGVKRGVIVLPAKSKDPADVLTKADGAQGVYDNAKIAQWAGAHGYRPAGYVAYGGGYFMYLWLSPSLYENGRIRAAVTTAQCRSETLPVPEALSDVPDNRIWPIRPAPDQSCR